MNNKIKKILISTLLIYSFGCICQNIPNWDISYITKNKIKSITTIIRRSLNNESKGEEEKIEKFNRNGKLIFMYDSYNKADHYFYYDSLKELISEKIIVNGKDSITQDYTLIYENGRLIQKLLLAKKAAFFFDYDINGKLIKETYSSGNISDHVFGTSFNFSEFSEFNSYVKTYNYIDNNIYITTIYNSVTYVDTLLYNSKHQLINEITKNGGIAVENIYSYKANKLIKIELKNCMYLYSYSKNLIKSIEKISDSTSKKPMSPCCREFEYEFW